MRRMLALALLNLAAPLSAECRLCVPGQADKAAAAKPLQMSVETTLDFSRAAQIGATAGSIEMNERTGARTVKGLADLGGVALLGKIRLTGEPGRRVRLILPAVIPLTSADGGTVLVSNVKADTGSATLNTRGELDIAFGGRLTVSARDAGDYRGRIAVTADYE